jgi:protein TonB
MKNPFDIRPAGRTYNDSRADSLFAPSLVVSIAIHLTAFVLVSTLSHQTRLTFSNAIPVTLLEPLQQQQEQTPARDLPHPIEKRKPPPEPAIKQQARAVKALDAPVKAKDEPAKPAESKASAPPAPPILPERAGEANGGAPLGASAFSPESQTGLASDPGSGGGGSAVAGLGRGSGAPGVPAPSGPLRTNSEAKAIQTVRAVYPPMALRLGMESDVTLRLEVDPAGNVTRAEIVKSGGAGFDEEALKAVRLSRFEPAQRDGRGVAAEFTYIYRFRLQR